MVSVRLISAISAITFLTLTVPFETGAEDAANLKKNILEEKKRLKNTLGEIEGTKRDIGETKLRGKDLLKELGDIEVLIDQKKGAAAKVANDLSELVKRIERETEKSEELKKDTASKKDFLKKRVVAHYKFDNLGPMKVLFSSDSYMTLLKRYRFMQLMMKNDISIINEYKDNLAALGSNIKQLNSARDTKEELNKDLAIKLKAAKSEQERKNRLLASIMNSKTLQEKALKEMEKSSVEIGKIIVNLENSLPRKAAGGAGGNFTSLKGRLDLPADGEIVAFFGKRRDPKFNTVIFQKGIEVAAHSGAEIRAIFGGKVLYADWFRGYGKIVIIDHGEGYYTLSAHASEIYKKVGDEVRTGNVIALVGDTGSLKGPYLYFEVRHKGKPVDPLDWLRVPD